MIFQENVILAPYTTFKIGGPARFFCTVRNETEVMEAVSKAQKEKLRILVIGGGSNILISDEGFSGLVIKNDIMGKSTRPLFKHCYMLSAGAGEQWDDVVELAVSNGLYGLENLSAIPGSVGAAPVQNIGAYGVEVSKKVELVRAFDLKKMRLVEFTKKDCQFDYRESIFKKRKGRYIITRVDFKLYSKGKVNIDYIDLKEFFRRSPAKESERLIEDNKTRFAINTKYSLVSKPTLREVRDAVISIRWRKLPDWKLWGTAGSFFKNPIVSKTRYEKLKAQYPKLPGWQEPDGRIKLPLGWILDHICKLKGVMIENVGNYENQALVIVTRPGATAAEVVHHAMKIMDTVMEKTGLKIEAEVQWVN